MKEYFQQRIDETRQSYLDALDRLKKGFPTHPSFQGKKYKINAANIALEAGKSRNPLYHHHKDILNLIHEIKIEEKQIFSQKKDLSEIEKLKQKIILLEEQNKQLLSINASLLLKIRSQ